MRRTMKLVPVVAVLLGFMIGGLIMLLTGHEPISAYSALLKGAGLYGDIKRLGDTLLNTTTLILTGLSVAFAFQTGLFNIGVTGQMLMGGLTAVLIGVKLALPFYIHAPLAVFCAMITGALWAYVPGVLKARLGIHEVVTGIMMNYVALWTVYYIVPKYIPGTSSTESQVIRNTASLRANWMSSLFGGSYINAGLFVALACVIIVWWILQRTTFGYELKACGYNMYAAKYAGMSVDRNRVLSMMMAGALAGLAGAAYYIGYANNMKIGVLPSQGPDGIAVALLGLNSPIGVLLAALLLGFMTAGRLFMQSYSNVPNELVSIIISVIIYFAATSNMVVGWLQKGYKLFHRKDGVS